MFLFLYLPMEPTLARSSLSGKGACESASVSSQNPSGRSETWDYSPRTQEHTRPPRCLPTGPAVPTMPAAFCHMTAVTDPAHTARS